ncbi:nucleotidyltransferase domain-containing protein [uncultured Ruthenibacterium sp.]|uniref:nucleotidyltransferase domain-containing protein n=1 Tax=uncultured Ruthenibacterium sp. TaxID=1905347 RepID=UPI00349E4F64
MIEVSVWMEQFQNALQREFGSRVLFIGLQGSYARGEAGVDSDLDLVVILDRLAPADIVRYRNVLDTLPHREKACGFLSGKAELSGWDPGERFQLCFDTLPFFGSLWNLAGPVGTREARAAVRTGAGTLYHACVHNLLYDRSEDLLRNLYKSACFVVQAVYYLETGHYVKQHRTLAQAAGPRERAILGTAALLRHEGEVDFEPMSRQLLLWSQGLLASQNQQEV